MKLKEVFGYKKKETPIATPVTPPAPQRKMRTLDNVMTAANIQRKYDPNMPASAPQSMTPEVVKTAPIQPEQGTAGQMSPEPEGFFK